MFSQKVKKGGALLEADHSLEELDAASGRALVHEEGESRELRTLSPEEFLQISLSRPLPQKLYLDQGRDFLSAVLHLSEAKDNYYIKITGGCLYWEKAQSEVLAVFATALQKYRGALGAGGTRSENIFDETDIRPGMPELGPIIERQNIDAKVLGLLPGGTLSLDTRLNDVTVVVDQFREKTWKIKLHDEQRHVLVASKETAYPWSAEGDLNERVVKALDGVSPLRGATIIAFDGGQGTREEIEKWERIHLADGEATVLLVTGGDSKRTTDSLANNLEWRARRPWVYTVPLDAEKIEAALRYLSAIR
ncbi:MAG: hypothetical protein KDD70_17550 [Bdellovibrionales bacterium]|nr:hypothetical protein [Bdellovibrionales bacterium]